MELSEIKVNNLVKRIKVNASFINTLLLMLD